MRAKSRLTNFLHEFYVRISQGKEQIGRSLYLPMHKVDIANHLGISPETLSRLLRELEEDGCIRNGVGQIELLQPEQNTSGSGKKCFYY